MVRSAMSVRHASTKQERNLAPESRLLIDDTLDVWQPYTSRRLTREDARQIAENVCGFFKVLLEWTSAQPDRRPTSTSRADLDGADET